ncbi:TIGR01244 family sulfur transferase [Erythrobacter sp.]|uniref:TIGR01244 family sulfur transferase n=1 Tax=Erythrobacter sp. TaxID=1042 RepID=UPI001B11B887|nr:TIGR01244 family sulfur transferase [Erythrobacter sp.]MBO6527204.1 TIGR01244 family phosphatase [Erythrobacter sp.]MBO6531432.1 TIGR01244 family phosphatase [Erythrobacter sp.]
MSEFRKLSNDFYASPQVTPQEISEAAAMGVALVVNNRPDGEAPDQPPGADIEAATRAAGMDYLAIPIGSAGFSEPQVAKLQDALAGAEGPVLGFCRSGTRSTLLWSLARARTGEDPEAISEAAASAGYDVSPVRPAMDMFAARARE